MFKLESGCKIVKYEFFGLVFNLFFNLFFFIILLKKNVQCIKKKERNYFTSGKSKGLFYSIFIYFREKFHDFLEF